MRKVAKLTLIAIFGVVVLCGGGVKTANAFPFPPSPPLPVPGAGPSLVFYDGTTSLLVTDDGALDTNATAGVVSYFGLIGSFDIMQVTAGVTKPGLGSASAPHMQIHQMQISSSAAGTLDVWFTDTDFTAPLALPQFNSSIAGSTSGTVFLETFADDPGNSPFGTTAAIASLGPLSGVPFSALDITPFAPVGPTYSLTMKTTITHSGGFMSSSFDADLIATPEPGTIALLGIGLAGLVGMGVRRKMKK